MIALGFYMMLLAIKLLGIVVYLRQYPATTVKAIDFDVTICQPILSGDPDLEATLVSNSKAIPDVNFIWVIDDDDETAREITSRIVQLFPSCAIRVISLPQPAEGISPKLHKLEAGRLAASSGVFVVLDDDTRLPLTSLLALLSALSRCELSTGLPYYRNAKSTYGNLLAQFVNNNSALTYLPILSVMAPVSINGMCYAIRTETLAQIGGFTPMLRNLTDDLAVADGVRAIGGRLVQTPFPQEVATTIGSCKQYFAQMHRWYVFALLLMRRRPTLINILMMIFYGVPPFLLIFALTQAVTIPSWKLSVALALTLLLRSLALILLQQRLTGKKRHQILLSLISEVLQVIHLSHAITIKTIRWRTRRYRVYDNDRFVAE